MVELGILRDDEPLELIDGELVIVSPQGPAHLAVTAGLRRMLEGAYGPRHLGITHSPLLAGDGSLPEPDVMIVRGDHHAFVRRLPTGSDAVLVVEIAQTSQAADRRKAEIYARAGVAVYWLLDLVARRLEVRTGPTEDGQYTETRLLLEDEEVALPGLDQRMAVKDMLP